MDVQSAIQCLFDAPDEDINNYGEHDKLRTVAQRLRAALNGKQGRPFKLYTAITPAIPWLWTLKEKSPSVVFQKKEAKVTDRRLDDIAHIEGKSTPTDEEKLFRGVAQRSLALQFTHVQRNSGREVQVDNVCKALSSLDISEQEKKKLLNPKRGGGVHEFVRDHICEEAHDDYKLAVRSVKSGVKQLVVEKLLGSQGCSAISALASMAKDALKNLPLEEIPGFIDIVIKSPKVNISSNRSEECHIGMFEIVHTLSPWYDQLQRCYDVRSYVKTNISRVLTNDNHESSPRHTEALQPQGHKRQRQDDDAAVRRPYRPSSCQVRSSPRTYDLLDVETAAVLSDLPNSVRVYSPLFVSQNSLLRGPHNNDERHGNNNDLQSHVLNEDPASNRIVMGRMSSSEHQPSNEIATGTSVIHAHATGGENNSQSLSTNKTTLESHPEVDCSHLNDELPPMATQDSNWTNFEPFDFDEEGFTEEVLAGLEDFEFGLPAPHLSIVDQLI